MTSFSWWCVPWSKLFSLGDGHPNYIDCGQIIVLPMTNAIHQKNDLLQIEFPKKTLALPLIHKKNPSTNLGFSQNPENNDKICYVKCKLPGLVHQHESQPSAAKFCLPPFAAGGAAFGSAPVTLPGTVPWKSTL